ncbi:1-acyl-sn-glycerol-3-phosphate acyltransferase [Priestia megaterium]|nr:1-acyl-sn-glycerol-3-phosphate acyltransferase [Priestia megaterium]
MIRTIVFFIYFFVYLVGSLPVLRKMKKLTSTLDLQRQREMKHQLPKRWARALMRITGSEINVRGQHNIPKGPVLFVSNHQGNFDVPVLLGFINKPFGFFSKAEVKKIPLVPRWMEVMECVFIDRSNRKAAVQSLKESVSLLKNGHSLVIFPEGTRSKGGPVGEFKTGGVRMAIEAGVPIVPIAIDGTYEIMEQSKFGFKKGHVTVTILPPVRKHLEPSVNFKAVNEEIRQQIKQEVELNEYKQNKSAS